MSYKFGKCCLKQIHGWRTYIDLVIHVNTLIRPQTPWINKPRVSPQHAYAAPRVFKHFYRNNISLFDKKKNIDIFVPVQGEGNNKRLGKYMSVIIVDNCRQNATSSTYGKNYARPIGSRIYKRRAAGVMKKRGSTRRIARDAAGGWWEKDAMSRKQHAKWTMRLTNGPGLIFARPISLAN